MEHLDRYHAKLYAAKLIASLDDNLMNFKSINFMPLSSSKTKRSNMDSVSYSKIFVYISQLIKYFLNSFANA